MTPFPGPRPAPIRVAAERAAGLTSLCRALPRVRAGRAAALPLALGFALAPGPASAAAAPARPVPAGRAPSRPPRPQAPASAPAPAPSPQVPASAPSTHTIARGQPLARVALRYRSGQYVELVAARSVTFPVPAGQTPVLRFVGIPHEVSGPLAARVPEGSAVVRVGGTSVATVELVTARAVAAATLRQRLGDYFSRPLTLALLGGLLACSLLLVILRRRAIRRRRARVERRAGAEVA